MTELKITLRGYNRVENKLRRLASQYPEAIDGAVGGWTKEQRKALKAYGYPPQRNAPQPFKSDRQRRFFFAALADGRISVPHRRTGRLANSWRAEKEGEARWALVNSARHAPLTIGKGTQAGYHKGHWWVAQDVVQEGAGELTRRIAGSLMELVQ